MRGPDKGDRRAFRTSNRVCTPFARPFRPHVQMAYDEMLNRYEGAYKEGLRTGHISGNTWDLLSEGTWQHMNAAGFDDNTKSSVALILERNRQPTARLQCLGS